MAILIDMEMPDSCHVCIAGYGGCCFVAPAESDGKCPDHGRPDWCPLVEVRLPKRCADERLLKEAGWE